MAKSVASPRRAVYVSTIHPRREAALDENKSFGARLYEALNRNELAVLRRFWHEIRAREDAERAIAIGQQGVYFAILIRVVFVLLPPSFETTLEINYGLLFEPLTLGIFAFYTFIYFYGYRRWWAMLLAMAVFGVDIILLPRETGGGTWFQLLLGIYVLRCFFVGVRGARWIDADDARLGPSPKSS